MCEHRDRLNKEVIGHNFSVACGLTATATSFLVEDENCAYHFEIIAKLKVIEFEEPKPLKYVFLKKSNLASGKPQH